VLGDGRLLLVPVVPALVAGHRLGGLSTIWRAVDVLAAVVAACAGAGASADAVAFGAAAAWAVAEWAAWRRAVAAAGGWRAGRAARGSAAAGAAEAVIVLGMVDRRGGS
jgi:hypothetical protein